MDIKQIINGQAVAALSGRTFVRHDPFTGAVASNSAGLRYRRRQGSGCGRLGRLS